MIKRVAYDLHGTIDIKPTIYKTFFKNSRRQGNEIYIISGPPTEQVIKELQDIDFIKGRDYDKAIGVVTYLLENGHIPTKIDHNGNYWFEEKAWWASKAQICTDYKISGLIDNEEQYAADFRFTKAYFYLIRSLPNDRIVLFKLLQTLNNR